MRPPSILAIECSTDCCSVALLRADQTWQLQENLRDKHSQTLLPLIGDVLHQASETRSGLTHIAVGVGPGSFTGVRTAVSVAQGLALGLGVPLFGVSGMDALALAAAAATERPARVLAVLDARMHEVYAALIEVNPATAEVVPLQAPAVMRPAQLKEWLLLRPDLYVGNGFAAYPAECADFINAACYALPQAQYIARLALVQIAQNRSGLIHDCQPQYVRNRIAATIAERQLLGHPA